MAFGVRPLGTWWAGGGVLIVYSLFLQDPFVAFHINKGLVRKYMNSLLIGELAPEQPSFEPTKNVRDPVCCLETWLWRERGRCLHRITGDSSWEPRIVLG